jgi:hypothetical protein
MAKADDKTSTKRISQREAVALLAAAYGVSEQVAKELLMEANVQGRTRAFPKLVRDGRSPLRQADPDTSIDLDFWRFDPEVEGNSARKRTITIMVLDPNGRMPPIDNSDPPLEFDGIEYLLAEVEALLPLGADQVADGGFESTKTWIANDVRQMKADGEIPADIRVTDLARQLAQRMHKAAKTNPSIRPIKPRSIENILRRCGLWPVPSIR